MKDEIKKKIEEEAIIFSKSNLCDSFYSDTNDAMCFIEGGKYGYSLAQQQSEKAVNEFKQRLIKAITSDVNFDDGYDSILSVQNIIEKLK